jgi:hypothetical protein
MGKRSRRRGGGQPRGSTTDYVDDDGNVLTLRDSASGGILSELRGRRGRAAATVDDMWRRETEMLFERFAVRWEIAGLPLEKQGELLARYRMADQATQRWVRETIDRHASR